MFTVCWPVVLSRWPFSESPPGIERGLHLLVVGCGIRADRPDNAVKGRYLFWRLVDTQAIKIAWYRRLVFLSWEHLVLCVSYQLHSESRLGARRACSSRRFPGLTFLCAVPHSMCRAPFLASVIPVTPNHSVATPPSWFSIAVTPVAVQEPTFGGGGESN